MLILKVFQLLIKSKFLLLNKLIISEIKGRKNGSITPVS